jgi:NADPH2:quinone reductase
MFHALPPPKVDQALTDSSRKLSEFGLGERNEGDDIAGFVHTVGSNVTEFHPGDRVAAFHVMRTPGGSFAEYARSPAHTTFHIPKQTSFEEAAAIPLAAATAAVGLYLRLGLPQPFTPVTESLPLVVDGAASAVGAYAVQLAKRSNIHPLICIAGRGIPFVETLVDKSKGDVIIDYRKGDDAVVQGIRLAIPSGEKLMYAFDAVSEKGSSLNICKVLSRGGKITTVLPFEGTVPEGIQQGMTNVGSVHQDATDFGFAWFRMFGRGLQEGWFKGHPQEVVPGGLGGIQQALTDLKEGKASAVKYVFRIADTEGISKSSL